MTTAVDVMSSSGFWERETGPIRVCFAFSFVSVEVEQAFSNVLRSKGSQRGALQLEIAEVNNDGYFQAQVIQTQVEL